MDLFDVRSALTDEERMVQDSVGRLVDEKVLPIIQKCFEEHRFPRELVPELAALGLLGSSIEGYGCAGGGGGGGGGGGRRGGRGGAGGRGGGGAGRAGRAGGAAGGPAGAGGAAAGDA